MFLTHASIPELLVSHVSHAGFSTKVFNTTCACMYVRGTCLLCGIPRLKQQLAVLGPAGVPCTIDLVLCSAHVVVCSAFQSWPGAALVSGSAQRCRIVVLLI